MGEMAKLLAHADERDGEWDKKCDDAHAELVRIAKRLLGHPVAARRDEVPPSNAAGAVANEGTSSAPQ